jgi:hypothetical protein
MGTVWSYLDSFDTDFGVDQWHGHNAFIRDGDSVYRTYFTNNRGDHLGAPFSRLCGVAVLPRRLPGFLNLDPPVLLQPVLSLRL